MFSSLLKSLREKKDVSQADLAKVLGVTQQAVGRWEKSLNMPDFETLKKIADYFHVTTDELLGRQVPKEAKIFPLTGGCRVPVLGSVRCGPGGLAVEESGDYISLDDTYSNPQEIRGFRAVGDSMEGDEIHDGDICLVRLADDVEDGALAVVVIDGEEGTLKRIHRSPGVVVLESSNPAYPPRVFTGEEANAVRIVGRIIEVRHKK